MITLEQSIPTASDAYLYAIPVFYPQFNEIEFYIEDEESENLYYAILKRLFPDLVFEKIFPLNGKKNVCDESTVCVGNKKKIFIVDKDFDDLHNTILGNDNLFYLEKYSIENYLVEELPLVAYIVDEKPRLKSAEVTLQLAFSVELKNCWTLFCRLTQIYFLVQKRMLGIRNAKNAPGRFFSFRETSVEIPGQLEQYELTVEAALKNVDGRWTLKGQLRSICVTHNLKRNESILNHIPGKYVLEYFKGYVEDKFELHTRNADSFAYQLAKHGTFENLNFLKVAIEKYIV